MAVKSAGATVIMVCGCTNEFQSNTHGGRVFNIKGGKEKSDVRYGRCTVCAAERLIPPHMLVV